MKTSSPVILRTIHIKSPSRSVLDTTSKAYNLQRKAYLKKIQKLYAKKQLTLLIEFLLSGWYSKVP